MVEILIVDKNINYSVKVLNEVYSKNINLQISGIAKNIEDMYKYLNTNSFDIVLFDYKLLSSAKAHNEIMTFIIENKKNIILLFEKEVFPKKYSSFNCAYKEDINALLTQIINLSDNIIKSKTIKSIIRKELEYIGYNSNHLGTMYIAEIIYLIYRTGFEGSLETKIYPYIAKKHNKSTNTIKCNIINATTLMFYDCPEDKLLSYLGKYSYFKPGPKTIIYTIVNKVLEIEALRI